jgi:hypothetical protein
VADIRVGRRRRLPVESYLKKQLHAQKKYKHRII